MSAARCWHKKGTKPEEGMCTLERKCLWNEENRPRWRKMIDHNVSAQLKDTLLQFFCILFKKYVFSYIEKYFFVYLLKISSKLTWHFVKRSRTASSVLPRTLFSSVLEWVCQRHKIRMHLQSWHARQKINMRTSHLLTPSHTHLAHLFGNL